MNQIAAQTVTATSATVKSETRMENFIKHHTYIYWNVNQFQEGIHLGYIQCVYDKWNEKEVFEISKEEFLESIIKKYFSLASTGTLAKYKGYKLDEDIFPELGELPELPRNLKNKGIFLKETDLPIFTKEGEEMETMYNSEDAADVVSSFSFVRAYRNPKLPKRSRSHCRQRSSCSGKPG